MKILQRLIQRIVLWIKPNLVLLDGEYKLTPLGGEIGFIGNIKFEHVEVGGVVCIRVPPSMTEESIYNMQYDLTKLFSPDKTILIVREGTDILKLNRIKETYTCP